MKNINQSKTTFTNAINSFLNGIYADNKAESTIQAYKTDLNHFKNFIKNSYPGIRYIQEIKFNEIRAYQVHLMNRKNSKESDKLQARTIDRRIFSLKSFYRELYNLKIVPENLLNLIDYKKEGKKKPDNYLQPKDIDILIDTVKKYGGRNTTRDLAIFTTLRYLGCRRSELLNLKWNDVSFHNKTIQVYRIKTQTYDVLPIRKELEEALLEYYYSSKDSHQEYIFISRQNGPLSKTAFNTLFSKYVDKSELEKVKGFPITAHTLRHSFCSTLAINNISLEKIRKFTGHLSNESLQPYVKLSVAHLSDVTAVAL